MDAMTTTRGKRSMKNAVPVHNTFEKTILPYGDLLYAWAHQLTRDPDDAQDLVQETLLRAYTRFPTFRDRGSARAWLRRILRSLFIDGYRKRSGEPPCIPLESVAEAGCAAARADSSPEQTVLARMEQAAGMDAVLTLPPAYRDYVILAHFHELSYQQIADRLRVPVDVVRTRLHRGRRHLHRSLQTWRADGGALAA